MTNSLGCLARRADYAAITAALLAVFCCAGCSPPVAQNDLDALVTAVRDGRTQSADRRVTEMAAGDADLKATLVSHLKSRNSLERLSAARVLVEMDPEDGKAQDVLLNETDNELPAARRLAAQGLGRADPPEKAAILALGRLTADPAADVAQAALESLRRIGRPVAETALAMLDEQRDMPRLLAVVPDHAVAVILDWCRENGGLRHVVRSRYLRNKLKEWLGDAAVPPLVHALQSEDAVVRELAADTLKNFRDSADAHIRDTVSEALAAYEPPQDESPTPERM
jgi:HEAT repeat protein